MNGSWSWPEKLLISWIHHFTGDQLVEKGGSFGIGGITLLGNYKEAYAMFRKALDSIGVFPCETGGCFLIKAKALLNRDDELCIERIRKMLFNIKTVYQCSKKESKLVLNLTWTFYLISEIVRHYDSQSWSRRCNHQLCLSQRGFECEKKNFLKG